MSVVGARFGAWTHSTPRISARRNAKSSSWRSPAAASCCSSHVHDALDTGVAYEFEEASCGLSSEPYGEDSHRIGRADAVVLPCSAKPHPFHADEATIEQVETNHAGEQDAAERRGQAPIQRWMWQTIMLEMS